jgi:hypothetical protein
VGTAFPRNSQAYPGLEKMAASLYWSFHRKQAVVCTAAFVVAVLPTVWEEAQRPHKLGISYGE